MYADVFRVRLSSEPVHKGVREIFYHFCVAILCQKSLEEAAALILAQIRENLCGEEEWKARIWEEERTEEMTVSCHRGRSILGL